MSDTSAPIAAPPGGDIGQDRSQDRKGGYSPMPERAPTPQRTEREFSSGREAADDLAKKRRAKGHAEGAPRPVGYWNDDKSYVAPDNKTVDLKRASDDLKAHRQVDAIDKELTDRNDLANKVDKLRKDANVPTVIDANAPPDLENPDARLFGDMLQTEPPQPQLEQPQHEPAPPGVDPDLHAAFQNPKIRAAVEAEVTRANEREVAFGDGLRVAQNAAIATFAAHYPEFVGKTPAQVSQAFAEMQRTNPQRAAAAQQAFQRAVQFESALAQNQARRQQAEQQQFQTYAREQDAAFNRMVGNQTPQHRQAIASEMISYAGEMGVDQKTLVHLMQTNPIMRHSAFQKMMTDAVAYRLGQKSLAAQRQQNRAPIPHVTPPGTSSGGGVRAVQNSTLASLSAKLNQSNSVKDAAALLLAQRNARKRG
jgi:hypothetical protein